MSRDDRMPPPDRPFALPGTGLPHRWECVWCGVFRLGTSGSRMVRGLRRCAVCIASRESRKQERTGA